MADLLARVLREIRERKEQARAAAEESQRLEAALAALDDERVESVRSPCASRRRRPAARAPRGANRAGVLAVVGERPGVSGGEVAGATGIARPTVTSTLAKLVADGALERVELPGGTRGYRLAEQPAADSGLEGERVSHEDVEGELVDEDVAEQPA